MKASLLSRPGAGCFWNEAREKFGEPNIHWCEQSFCSIIEQPATTWSNLAIIFVGALIMLKHFKEQNRRLRNFGLSIFLMGVFSFIYHAGNNWPLQILDFVGMYLYTGMIITLNFERLKLKTSFTTIFWLVFTLNMLLIPIFHNLFKIHIQYIVLLNILTVIAQEYLIRKTNKNYSLKFWNYTLFFIFIAQLFSLMDANRIYCNPTNLIIHGHALWHMSSAVSAYFAYLFYKNLE